MTNERRYGLVEAGGTKFLLGISDVAGTISAETRIATTTPDETLPAMLDWFAAQAVQQPLTAIGIASFGPLQLDRAAPDWGHITRTTKPGWSDTDIAGPLIAVHHCPVGFDTDVNGAARAEALWGAGKGHASTLYLTVGTGIGGGACIDGHMLHGLSHPEMGHIRVPRHPHDADFAGACLFHGDCLEGLASGPAISARWGASLSQLGPDHPAHEIIAYYLGQACCTFQAMLEPARIILGGGVMGTPGLLEKIKITAAELGKGYFVGDPHQVIVAPGLGERAGLLGALALALAAEQRG
jgi:fructokinase